MELTEKFHFIYQVRKLFTCASYLCQTLFMTLTAALMKRGWAITCISLSLGCGGFAWAGFSINHLDIAPQVDNMSNTNKFIAVQKNYSIMNHNRLSFYHIIFIVCSNPHGNIKHDWNNTRNHQPASYWISNQR